MPQRSHDYVRGDLIIGGCMDGVEHIMLRCDPDADDYGSVISAREIMGRDEWPLVARSLSEFITACLDRLPGYGDR